MTSYFDEQLKRRAPRPLRPFIPEGTYRIAPNIFPEHIASKESHSVRITISLRPLFNVFVYNPLYYSAPLLSLFITTDPEQP